MDILYIDNHLLVVNKPAGVLVQGDDTGDECLLDIGKSYIKKEFNKPGNVFLGLIHRLDRPVSGVIVMGRTSKAASRLSDQFRRRATRKVYWALVEGKTPEQGTLINEMDRKEATSFIARKGQGKLAELSYRRLKFLKKSNCSLVEVELKTGRHHQIRLQFSHIGHSLLGDFRYGSKIKFPNRTIALHARQLFIEHPTKKEPMEFTVEPPASWAPFL